MERYTAKRRGILIPLEGVAYLRQLSKDDIGEIMSSLFAYVLGEDADEAALPYPLRKAFNAIREEVDKAENEYQRKAKAGASKKKSGADTEQTRSRAGADTEQKRSRAGAEKAKAEMPGFAEAWEAYPRKQGRKAALAAYEKAVKKGADKEAILKGVVAYAEYVKRNGIESQYIKQGSTFFNGEHWGDDWSITHTHKSRGDMTAQEFVNQWNINETEVNCYDTTGSKESGSEYPLIGGVGLSSF